MAKQDPLTSMLPIVLVDGGPDGPFPKLAEVMDADRRSELQAALVRRTLDWAASLGEREPIELAPAKLAEAAGGEQHGAVVIRPALVRFGDRLADDLRDDLRHDCGLVLGPTLAGGWYLLALRPLEAKLLEAAGDGGPGTAGGLLAAAAAGRVETGLLGAERDLVREADLRAAQADPLLDDDIARLLTP